MVGPLCSNQCGGGTSAPAAGGATPRTFFGPATATDGKQNASSGGAWKTNNDLCFRQQYRVMREAWAAANRAEKSAAR
eukprot:14626749-Alexandrium_andersonii.AAC.1